MRRGKPTLLTWGTRMPCSEAGYCRGITRPPVDRRNSVTVLAPLAMTLGPSGIGLGTLSPVHQSCLRSRPASPACPATRPTYRPHYTDDCAKQIVGLAWLAWGEPRRNTLHHCPIPIPTFAHGVAARRTDTSPPFGRRAFGTARSQLLDPLIDAGGRLTCTNLAPTLRGNRPVARPRSDGASVAGQGVGVGHGLGQGYSPLITCS